MSDFDDRLTLLESEIERRLGERFAALRDEFERLRVESDRRWEGFLSRFDQDFRGIVPPELLLPPTPPPAPEPPSAPAGEPRGTLSLPAVRTLDSAGNQVETLHRFLDLCREHASRAALLIARAGGFGVWKAVGFADHGGNDEAVRHVSLPGEGELARVVSGTPILLRGDNDVSRRLLASGSVAAVLVPMVVKEKISGAVYADAVAGEEERFDSDSIALLTFLAGLSVDRLASRKLKPAPPLAEPLEAEPARPPAAEPADSAVSEYSLAEQAAPEPPPPASLHPEPAPPPVARMEAAPEPAREPEPEPAREPEPSIRESWRPRAPETSFAETESSPAAIQFEPETPAEAAHPPDFAASTPPRISVGTRRLAGPLAPSSEADERRDEARRFARLLVSEIKLYNERAVLEGREHGNLYARLKEDIDRSRQMYDDRIPQDIRASSNFFYEELVRVLADGRADALGM